MDAIIQSMIDDDQYKLSTQMAILELFPDAIAHYKFKMRGKTKFTKEFVEALKIQIQYLSFLRLTAPEKAWLSKASPYFKIWYLEYLYNYRYNPKQVIITLSKEGDLDIDIVGKWCEAVLWEVKLMAIISELYFLIIDKNWSMDGQEEKAKYKLTTMGCNGCVHTDFATRRRRNFETQRMFVELGKKSMGSFEKSFVGTSNTYLSYMYDLTPKGTMPHEWLMGMQALEGIRNSNYYGMSNWVRVYNGDLGTVLPDTLGLKQFLKNFNLRFAKLFDGVRHDSGDPFWFTSLVVDHYRSLKINPMLKTIIFSNALDCKRAIAIKDYCQGKINSAFGIGTHYSNDFDNSPALNMVIKLYSINDIPVVKISDDEGKEMGDKDALRATKWECFGTPLDK